MSINRNCSWLTLVLISAVAIGGLFNVEHAIAAPAVHGSYVGQMKLVHVDSQLARRGGAIYCTGATSSRSIGFIVQQRGAKVSLYNVNYDLIATGKATGRGFRALSAANGTSLEVIFRRGSGALVKLKQSTTFKSGNKCKFSYRGTLKFYPELKFIPIAG
jgi:hypothetical protein